MVTEINVNNTAMNRTVTTNSFNEFGNLLLAGVVLI